MQSLFFLFIAHIQRRENAVIGVHGLKVLVFRRDIARERAHDAGIVGTIALCRAACSQIVDAREHPAHRALDVPLHARDLPRKEEIGVP